MDTDQKDLKIRVYLRSSAALPCLKKLVNNDKARVIIHVEAYNG
jgi:hypothetical protein